jgi:hypothetical protein
LIHVSCAEEYAQEALKGDYSTALDFRTAMEDVSARIMVEARPAYSVGYIGSGITLYDVRAIHL